MASESDIWKGLTFGNLLLRCGPPSPLGGPAWQPIGHSVFSSRLLSVDLEEPVGRTPLARSVYAGTSNQLDSSAGVGSLSRVSKALCAS